MMMMMMWEWQCCDAPDYRTREEYLEWRKEQKELKIKKAWQHLRRVAPLVGMFALFCGRVHNEVIYRPGGRGMKRAREEFEVALSGV